MHSDCPFCNEMIDDEIQKEWVQCKDYAVWFETECPKCKSKIEVEVQQEPVFFYDRPEKVAVFKNP